MIDVYTKNKCPNCNENYLLTFAGFICPKCKKKAEELEAEKL